MIWWSKKCTPPPGYLLRKAANLRQKKINEGMKSFNLTHVQLILLAYSYHHQQYCTGDLTQTTIAHEAQIGVMMTSKVLRTLEAKWLIKRQKSKTDTRSFSVHITSDWKKLFAQAMPVAIAINEEFYSPLKDLKQYNEILSKLITPY